MDLEPDVDESLTADELVDADEDGDDDPLGDALEVESADELDAAEFELDDEDDDEESDDDVEELESGSAKATPGMVATAIPIHTATANAPTRPINLALHMMIPLGSSPVQSCQSAISCRDDVVARDQLVESNRLLEFLRIAVPYYLISSRVVVSGGKKQPVPNPA